jgi:lipoate-protein ligase A
MAEPQPTDANSRLKARVRATVPTRDTSLFRREIIEDSTVVSQTQIAEPTSENLESKQQNINATKHQVNNLQKPQALVSFTLRVDESIDRGLKSLCSGEKITKETFLEAAYLVCEQNQEMMAKVLEISKLRRKERREVGVTRRAQSMTKYLS